MPASQVYRTAYHYGVDYASVGYDDVDKALFIWALTQAEVDRFGYNDAVDGFKAGFLSERSLP